MRDAVFIGKILASVTHEMQNVMAIIKESGALTEDILNINGKPKLKHGDKMLEALRNIDEQSMRGRTLMLSLNGFAHAAEDFPQCCELSRFIKQIASLAERNVRLKNCSIQLELGNEPLIVKGNALYYMQIIYDAFFGLLAVCPPDAVLTTSIFNVRTENCQVRVKADKCSSVPEQSQAFLELLQELKADCTVNTGEFNFLFMRSAEA